MKSLKRKKIQGPGDGKGGEQQEVRRGWKIRIGLRRLVSRMVHGRRWKRVGKSIVGLRAMGSGRKGWQ